MTDQTPATDQRALDALTGYERPDPQTPATHGPCDYNYGPGSDQCPHGYYWRDPMTEQTPATEAASDIGRRNIERYLDHEFGITTNDAELGGLLNGWRDAIEAEARAAVPACRCKCYGCQAASHDDD